MSIEEQLRQHILHNFMYAGGGEQLSDEFQLFDHGVIDSTGVLELVAFIEETFSMKVDDSDLIPENFASVAAIAGYVRGQLGAHQAAG